MVVVAGAAVVVVVDAVVLHELTLQYEARSNYTKERVFVVGYFER